MHFFGWLGSNIKSGDLETLHDKLDADLALMRKVFNQRIIYFRQLQEISDSVVQAEWDGPVEIAIAEEVAKNKALDTKLAVGRSRQRYLANLVQSKGKMDDEDEDDACTLCKCEFTRGYITQWYVYPLFSVPWTLLNHGQQRAYIL